MPEPSRTEDASLRAALAYLARGWSVVPAAERGKRPIVRWQTFEERYPTESQVRRWFERWPSANLSVVTGAISGIVVLDVDPRHGGEESLKQLALSHAELPETVEAATGGGGRHIYFKHPGFEVRNRAGLLPGLDLRGDGGVIIVPPSIHPSGKPYRWRKGHGPDEIAFAPLPDWLLSPRFGGSSQRHPLSYWRNLAREGVSEGQRNATITSFTGHLLWHGVDPDVALELMLAWNRAYCRPPLEDEEVTRTVRSIERIRTKGNDKH
jgi:hypothetical protein